MVLVMTWPPCNDGQAAANDPLVTVLQQLLLIPLLAPLLAVLLLGAINPRPPVALRLLIWTSPALPLGSWIAAAAVTGAGLSAAATTLALRQGLGSGMGSGQPQARFTRGPASPGPGEAAAASAAAGRHRPPAAGSGGGPSRAPGEPAPTVEVAYRVIRRPSGAPPQRETTTQTTRPEPSGAQAVGDGWDQPLNDSWE